MVGGAIGSRISRRGFTIAEAAVALVVITMAGMGFGSLMIQGNQNNQHMTTVGSQMDFQNQVRLALLSRAGLNNTLNANPQLMTCMYTGCAVTNYRLQIRDAQNRIVLPLPTLPATEVLVAEAKGATGDTVACAPTDMNCRWTVAATFAPVCVGATCRAGSFNVQVTIRHTPRNPSERVDQAMANRTMTLSIANDTIADPVKVAAALCPNGQYLRGYTTNAQPVCENVSPNVGATGAKGANGAAGVCTPAACDNTVTTCTCDCTWGTVTP